MKPLDFTNYMWLHCNHKIGKAGRGKEQNDLDLSGLDSIGQIEWSLNR